MVKPFKTFLFFLVPVILASCATVVSFNVTHPPLVDLRNVSTITVIPFEWSSSFRYTYLAGCVTSQLIRSIEKGKINFVDPSILIGVDKRDYWKYVDVYITGYITKVDSYDHSVTSEETHRNRTRIKYITTRTADVSIDYRYVRSADDEVLGYFKKSATHSSSMEYYRRGENVRRPERFSDAFHQRGTWSEGIAESAIAQFSNAFDSELAPWTTTEERSIKGRAGKGPQITEARNLIRENNYSEAVDIYKNIYEQTGNIFAGYNTAVLLEASERFTDAFLVLEKLKNDMIKSGKTIPSFIRKELKNVQELVNGLMILSAYRESPRPPRQFTDDEMVNNAINYHFISPFRGGKNIFYYENYSGIDNKVGLFTYEIKNFYTGIFGCGHNENIFSMSDGKVKEIGLDKVLGSVVIISYEDMEIHYLAVTSANISEGDIIKKGQLIGKVAPPYFDFYGPALYLRIKYNGTYYDKNSLLCRIMN